MQGFNMGRYYPPDQSGDEQARSGQPKQERRKQTVRFEIPFSIVCLHCQPEAVIGQGVRFNAVKSKVGAFFTTPIWGFRFTHPSCGGSIEIRTDPENTDYAVEDGARRQYPPAEPDADTPDGGFESVEARNRRDDDGFAALEHRTAEGAERERIRRRIDELYSAQDQHWDDPYTANQRIRTRFRAGRKAREAAAADRRRIQMAIGWDGPIADPTREDDLRASLVSFGNGPASIAADIETVTARPLLGSRPRARVGTTATTTDRISRIARMAADPFLGPTVRPTRPKRRRRLSPAGHAPPQARAQKDDNPCPNPTGLVGYLSDDSD